MNQSISVCSKKKTQNLERLQQQYNFSDDKAIELQKRAKARYERGKERYRVSYDQAIRQQLQLSHVSLEALKELQTQENLNDRTVASIQKQVDLAYEKQRQQYKTFCLEHLCQNQPLSTLDRSHLQKQPPLIDYVEISNLESQAEQEFKAKQEAYKEAFDKKLRQDNLNPRIRTEISPFMPYPRLSDDCLEPLEKEVRQIFEQDKKRYKENFGDALCRSNPLDESEKAALHTQQIELRFSDDLARSFEEDVLTEARSVCRQEILKHLLHPKPVAKDRHQSFRHLREWSLLGDEAGAIEQELTEAIAGYKTELTQLMRSRGQTDLETLSSADLAALQQYRIEYRLQDEEAIELERQICAQLKQEHQNQQQCQYEAAIQQYENAVKQQYQNSPPDHDFLKNLATASQLKPIDVETITARVKATLQQESSKPALPLEPRIPLETVNTIDRSATSDEINSPLQATVPQSIGVALKVPPSISIKLPPQAKTDSATIPFPKAPAVPSETIVRAHPLKWVGWTIWTTVIVGAIALCYQQWQADQTAQKQLQDIRQLYATKKYDACLSAANTFPQENRLSSEAQSLKRQCHDARAKTFLQQAQAHFKQGELTAAIAQANQVEAKTAVYTEAQRLIRRIGERQLPLAKEYYLEQGDWKRASVLLGKIPKNHPDYRAPQPMTQTMRQEFSTNQKALADAKKALSAGDPYRAQELLRKIKTTWQGQIAKSIYWEKQAKPHLEIADRQIQAIELAAAQRRQAQMAPPSPPPSSGNIDPHYPSYTPPSYNYPSYDSPAPSWRQPAPSQPHYEQDVPPTKDCDDLKRC